MNKILIFLFACNVSVFAQKEMQLDYGSSFYNGYAFVKRGNTCFSMDTTGGLMEMPCRGGYHVNKYGKLLIQKSDKELQVYNRSGQKLEKTLVGKGSMKYDYYTLFTFSEGYFIIDSNYQRTATIGEIDVIVYGVKQFEEIGPGLFKKAIYNKDKRIRFQLLNHKGEVLSKTLFVKLGEFNSGLAKAKVANEFGEEKWGYVTSKGAMAIEAKFSKEPTDFMGNRAFVEFRSGNFAMISDTGGFITKDIYDFVEACSENRFFIVDAETRQKFLIDSNNVKIQDLNRSNRYFASEDNEKSEALLYRYAGKDGLVDFNGKELIKADTYSDIAPLRSGLCRFYQTGSNGNPSQKGYLNSKGEKVIVFSNGPGY